MKKVVFFLVLLAVSIWTLVYVARVKEDLNQKQQKPTVVESQTSSSSLEVQSSTSVATAPTAVDYRLRILSEPPGATIFIDEVEVGHSPFEVSVPSETKRLRLSLDGYDDYDRQIPAARDSEGDLVWKIQMKKKQSKLTVKFYEKSIGPFSIQLKAIPLSDFRDQDAELATKAKLCRVVINENVWVRVIVGPFANKKIAQESLKKYKMKYPEAFVGTKHQCLGESESP